MTAQEIGSIIKEARLSKKMTQNEVVGDFITRNMLSLIENGTATPSIRTLQYLATKLQIPMSQFSFDDIRNTETGCDAMTMWKQIKHNYENHKFDICLQDIKPFLSEEHPLHDEACALAALCHLSLANHYASQKELPAAAKAAKEAAHYAGIGIFRNQQVISESILLLNQLAQEAVPIT